MKTFEKIWLVVGILQLILVLVITSGCQNYRKIVKNNTTTTIDTVFFQKDGVTPAKKEVKTVILVEDVDEKDDGFTVGSKGLGSYSFLRDISFM